MHKKSKKILIIIISVLIVLSLGVFGFLKFNESKQEAIVEETPIEEVEFSVRAYNCLKRHGVHTIQDLVDMTELEVTKIRNLGKKSLKEVIDKVSDLGLKFKE